MRTDRYIFWRRCSLIFEIRLTGRAFRSAFGLAPFVDRGLAHYNMEPISRSLIGFAKTDVVLHQWQTREAWNFRSLQVHFFALKIWPFVSCYSWAESIQGWFLRYDSFPNQEYDQCIECGALVFKGCWSETWCNLDCELNKQWFSIPCNSFRSCADFNDGLSFSDNNVKNGTACVHVSI